MSSIIAENLSRSFGTTLFAVRDAGFEIPQGSVFGFLGPNGSGKTTTVRLLNGILAPTSGHASVFGFDSVTDAVKIHEISGVLTETAGLYEMLSGIDNLLFFARIYGMSEADAKERSKNLLAEFELSDAAKKPVKTWSTGMKKKLALARALLHRPKVLFLDEPTSGLDPEAAAFVNSLVARMARDEGVTVFLCTHQLKYAEEICSLYGLISQGTIIAFGSQSALCEGIGQNVRLSVRGKSLPAAAGFVLQPDGTFEAPVKDDADAALLIRKAVEGGGVIYEAQQKRMDLEDLYFAYRKRHTASNTDLNQIVQGGAK